MSRPPSINLFAPPAPPPRPAEISDTSGSLH